MKIYILSRGNYSNCNILGIFSTQERAALLRSKMDDDRINNIDEYELDEFAKDNRLRFLVEVWPDRIEVRFSNDDSEDLNEIYHYNSENYYSLDVMAEDKEHAIKIASDLIAQFKALNGET